MELCIFIPQVNLIVKDKSLRPYWPQTLPVRMKTAYNHRSPHVPAHITADRQRKHRAQLPSLVSVHRASPVSQERFHVQLFSAVFKDVYDVYTLKLRYICGLRK